MKIAVFRALQLGDLLCTVPALRALDAAYPSAHISLIGLPWARSFVARFQRYLDAFIEFPGFPGMPERAVDFSSLALFFESMKKARFDLVLQMHGDGRLSNPIAALMGAETMCGYWVPGRYRPQPGRFIEWREREHEVHRWLRLLEHAGVPPRGTHLEFPLLDQDWAELRGLGLSERAYAVIHPGSQLPSRRWPPERFAEVADELARRGHDIVVTGVESEGPVVEKVKSAMRHSAVDLCGRTRLGGLAALIARARLLVCNDTGVSHLAAALGTPSVVIACGSDPERWAPLNRELHRVLAHEVECRPCGHYDCPVGHTCAFGISTCQVVRETERLAQCAA
jgi:ADP-heptose:LPS heptosyltransferase